MSSNSAGLRWPKLPPKVRLFKKSRSVVSARLVGLDFFLAAVIDRISSMSTEDKDTPINQKYGDVAIRTDGSDSPLSVQKLRLMLLEFLDASGHTGSHQRFGSSTSVLMHRLYGVRSGDLALSSNEREASNRAQEVNADVDRLRSGRETNRETRIMEQHIRLMSPEALAICVVIFSMVIGNFYQIMSIVDSSGTVNDDFA